MNIPESSTYIQISSWLTEYRNRRPFQKLSLSYYNRSAEIRVIRCDRMWIRVNYNIT